MNAKETIAAAKRAAEQHKTKKVLKAQVEGDKFPEYDFVAVKTVHVTMPGEACYIDMSEKDLQVLNERVIDKKLSLHEFVFASDVTKETIKK
jgi:hypothetical protein